MSYTALGIFKFADKCRLPFYGGCELTRECVTTAFGQNCGNCLTGYTPRTSLAILGPYFGK